MMSEAISTPVPLLPDPHTALRRQVIATHCLHCGRPLCDATSAAMGLGPSCRKRMGLDETLKKNPQANELIARAALAAEDGQLQSVRDCLTRVLALDPGYQVLAEKVQARLFRTRVTFDAGYYVASTYNPSTVNAFKDLGMQWRPSRKAWFAGDDSTLNDALDVLADVQPGGEILTMAGEIHSLATWRV